jgi:hypothetical protein
LLTDISIALPFTPREFHRLNPFAAEFRYDDESIALITRDEGNQLTQRTLGQRSFRSLIRQCKIRDLS